MTESENHPSKPLRKTRLFLKEVAIIVLGVSIALAAEQAVANWREQRQYLEARQAIRTEISYSVTNLARRSEFLPCIKRRLDEIGALLDKAEARRPITPVNWVGEAYSFRIRFAAEPAVSDSDLFSPEEQRQYSLIYSWLHSIDLEQAGERLAWARLQMLEGRATVPPDMINTLRTAIAEARFEDERIRFLQGWLRIIIRQAGIGPYPNDAMMRLIPDQWPQCLPMATPREEALRITKRFIEQH